MGKIPNHLRETIARNIRAYRVQKYPGRGGAKQCAEIFGVSPQQWSPWERGLRTPDESRLLQIAKFFNVTVEDLRRDTSDSSTPPTPPPAIQDTRQIIYLPVFVLLPHLPENMQSLYDQFYSLMNSQPST